MIDLKTGEWSYDPSEPINEWCDMDYVADYIVKRQKYVPKTDLGTMIDNIIYEYSDELFVHGKSYFAVKDKRKPPMCYMINIDDVAEFVAASGGLEAFDYYDE